MDKARIAAGLSVLVTCKEFTKRIKQIKDIATDWQDTPLLFGGPLEPLNALVDVGVTKPEALDKLIDLATAKRRQVPVAKRVDYQRDLMRAKRERLYKALKLEELVRGSPVSGTARQKYMLDTQKKWVAERKEFISKKGSLSWKERNEAANEFWRKVDERLDHDLAEAQAVLDRPPVQRHPKRVVKVEKPIPNTAMGRAFKASKSR